MALVLVYVAVFVTVFALVDPLGALPFFVALTDGFSDADRAIVIRRAVLVLGSTLTVFAFLGTFLFAAFGLTLAAFEIAGGVLLFIVAYDMLHGEVTRTKLSTEDRAEAAARRDEISVVPLGIPLLAGPGAISTVMIYEGSAGNDSFMVVSVFLAIVVTTILTFFILKFGQRLMRYLGRTGIMAMTRVLGLLLAAVGVQFVINGIFGAFGHP
ncbi:MAG TPA: NAAT family transporter [Thermoplasmata archaeon]|nr:NAAT family transporter [Thermoplasmata archaeon]